MSKINTRASATSKTETTHGGSPAAKLDNYTQLRRAVLACLLWEDQFYESGEAIADRIVSLAHKCSIDQVLELAVEARTEYNLRHAPLLLLVSVLGRGEGKKVGKAIADTIQRADELTEILAIYWKDGKKPIPKQLANGLRMAFRKFDAYQLAKYNRDGEVKLRDILRLVHPKPKDDAQAALWKSVLDGTLAPPDTWEVALSRGADKGETFARLIREKKLGYMALLRNLRNMIESKVDQSLIEDALLAGAGRSRVLPFRFLSAAKAAPRLEGVLDKAMLASLDQMKKLPGKTIVIVDVSGSMYGANLSAKSELNRAEGAAALAAMIRGAAERPVIYATAGSDARRIHATAEVPARQGMALIDAIYKDMYRKLGGGGIFLTQVIDYIQPIEVTADRIIVITDEQDTSGQGANAPSMAKPFGTHNYLVNVGSYANSIATKGKWVSITGFSEGILTYIREYEESLVEKKKVSKTRVKKIVEVTQNDPVIEDLLFSME